MKVLQALCWYPSPTFMNQSRLEEHQVFLSWLINVIEEQKIDLFIVSKNIFDINFPSYIRDLYYDCLGEYFHQELTFKPLKQANNIENIVLRDGDMGKVVSSQFNSEKELSSKGCIALLNVSEIEIDREQDK